MNHLEKRIERIEEELDEQHCRHEQVLVVPCPEFHRGATWPGAELVRLCQVCHAVVPASEEPAPAPAD